MPDEVPERLGDGLERPGVVAVPRRGTQVAEERGVDATVEPMERLDEDAEVVPAFPPGSEAEMLGREELRGASTSIPPSAEEDTHHRARTRHDGDVREEPTPVVGLEILDELSEEGMPRGRHEKAVGDARGLSGDGDGGEAAEGAEGALAFKVEVEEDAAKVVENEVAKGVGALDRIAVAVKGREEPRVVGLRIVAQRRSRRR
jgi:hypothetical protein